MYVQASTWYPPGFSSPSPLPIDRIAPAKGRWRYIDIFFCSSNAMHIQIDGRLGWDPPIGFPHGALLVF